MILVPIFEIGSIICATATSSRALIAGRAITGIGGAGISAGAFVLVNLLVPLQARPKYTGEFHEICLASYFNSSIGGLGAVFGISSIIGPLIGGYLTAVTWRWCFWINVPVGGASLVLLVILTPNKPPPASPADSLLGKVKQLDPLGFLLIAAATVCLLFALQWGGILYPWNDSRIIALFVLFGVLLITFIPVQIWRKIEATVPPKIFLQRSIFSGSIASFGLGSVVVLYAFHLPIWFQAIKGQSPQSSGLSLLGLLLSNSLLVVVAGVGTSILGYYTPFMIFGGALLIVGSALITTWEVDTLTGIWIGYQVRNLQEAMAMLATRLLMFHQIIVGAALGFVFQQPNIAAQTVLPKDQVPTAISLLTFLQFVGATIFVTVGQTLVENKLVSGLQRRIQGFDPASIANSGATSIRQTVPPEKLPLVLDVYNDSLRAIWYLCLALSCLVFASSFGLEWRSVKGEREQKNEDSSESRQGPV